MIVSCNKKYVFKKKHEGNQPRSLLSIGDSTIHDASVYLSDHEIFLSLKTDNKQRKDVNLHVSFKTWVGV